MAKRALAPRSAGYVSVFDLLDLSRSRVRLEALVALARSPMDVGSLAARLELELSHVSRCLGALESAGLVVHTCQGHKRIYRPGPALGVAFAGGGASLSLRAESGSEVVLNVSAAELAELEGVAVVTTLAATLAPMGNVQTAPRLASGL